MREVSVLRYESGTDLREAPVPRPELRPVAGEAKQKQRVILLQTQAENAGAQEISRLLGAGLSARGHEVFTPTLTGVADRSHLLSPQVDLETHIADVTNLILWEELTDVILCGHSYGGCVISGVADRVPAMDASRRLEKRESET